MRGQQLTFISLCESRVRKQTSILTVFENVWKAYLGEEQIVDLLSSESARRRLRGECPTCRSLL